MRSRHHRLRSLGTGAALVVLGSTAGLSSAGADALSPVPVGPNQAFVGQVNGATIGAVVKVACSGPWTPASTGHPLPGQQLSAQLVSAPTPTGATVGYTGAAANRDQVSFSNSPSTVPAAEIKAYGLAVAIPTTLNLPCSGTGTVAFVPAPSSNTAQTARVDVTYISVTP